MRQLLAGGEYDVNATNSQGFTLLHLAAQQQAVQTARLLITHGADVDARNQYANTPLFTAVFNTRETGDLIKLLREAGADPHATNNAAQTPVGLARRIGNYDVAQYFEDVPEG